MFVNSLLSFAALGLAAIRGPLLEHAGDPGGGGAPAGGGRAPESEPTADPAQGDVPDAAEAGAEGLDAQDHDDLGNDDADEREFVERLPEPNLRTRVRRAQRYRREAEPIVNLFRGPDGKLLPAQEVNRMLANHREFENLDRVLRSDPKLVQAFLDADARLRNGGQPAAAEDEHPPFDEETWEFETDTPQGKRLLAEAKRTHALEGELKQLRKLVTGVQQHTQQQSFSTLETKVKSIVMEGAKQIDPLYQKGFVRGAKAHFEFLRATNRLTPQAMQAFVDDYLAPVVAAKKTNGRAAAGKASAMASANGTLPKTPRPGTVSPAAGNAQPNTRQTIADGRKAFFQRVGVTR